MGAACCSAEKKGPEAKIEGSIAVLAREKRVLDMGKDRIDDFYQFETGHGAVLSSNVYGSVFKATHKKSRGQFAIRQIGKEHFKNAGGIQEELETLKGTDHPHICKVLETYEDNKNVYMVMELCRGGDLSDLYTKHSRIISEVNIAILVRQMVSAANHFHERLLVHGELRLESWLFSGPLTAGVTVLDICLKMIDFGIVSKQSRGRDASSSVEAYSAPKISCKEQRSAFCRSPEQLEGEFPSRPAADVWAIGVIAFFMLCGQTPFPRSAGSKHESIMQAKFEFEPPAVWNTVSSDGKAFISQCLRKDPAARPSSAGLLTDAWLRKAKSEFDVEFQARSSGRASVSGGAANKRRNSEAPLPTASMIVNSFKRMNRMNVLEKAAITAAAHRLPSDKIKYLRQTFEKMDKNGDGVLCGQELHDGLKASGVSDTGLMDILKEIDTDGSGQIEYTEFIAATYEFQRNMQENIIWSVFRIFDEDGSGTVTKKELLKILGGDEVKQKISDAIPGVDLKPVMDMLDKDGDGSVDYEEFKKLLMRADHR